MSNKHRLSGTGLALVLMCACVSAGGTTPGPASVGSYEELVEVARQDPANVDYIRLRMAWVGSQNYDPFYRESAEFSELFNALSAAAMSDGASLESPCASIPDQLFTDIAVHVLCANLATATGDRAGKRFHVAVANGLLRSIGNNRDAPPDSGEIVVVSAYEQMEYLKRSPFRGVQSGPGHQGALTDTAVVINEDGKEATLLFVKHPAFASQERTHGP